MKNVFCLFHTDYPPYYNAYIKISKKQRGINIPLAVMAMRWDGLIGFPGGKVDLGETWEQALIRELKEEINFTADPTKFVFLGTFKDSSVWTYKLDGVEAVKQLIADSLKGKDFLSELQGLFAIQLASFECRGYRKECRGIRQFLKSNFSYTAKEELLTFIEKIHNDTKTHVA